MLWLTGGGLAISVVMVAGLLALIFWKGMGTFWPVPIVRVETFDNRAYMGEITRSDVYRPSDRVLADFAPEITANARRMIDADGMAERRLVRTGNFRLTQNHFSWVNDFEVAKRSEPEWALVLERREWGRFYGFPEAFVYLHRVSPKTEDGRSKSPEEVVSETQALYRELHVRTEHALRWIDRRGSEQEVFLPIDQVEQAQQLSGVAEYVEGPENAWRELNKNHQAVRERWHERRHLEKIDTGEVNYRQEQARLAKRKLEVELAEMEADGRRDSTAYKSKREKHQEAEQRYREVRAWADKEFLRIRQEIDAINRENERYQILMRTAGEGELAPQTTLQRLDDIVRVYPANQLSFGTKLATYLARWGELLIDEPREANSEGGVYPAIFGTVAMTLIMATVVVPFGVLAALYLREYAKAGPIVSSVRIAVNNLAGVPSIVFGVFGLGFFCYVVGASFDELFFAASLPNPTYGKGGLLWASLTLALLTLPVVIVATEEAVSAVPSSMREGSYACGASRWQTIQRIVLPRALPGIITGMILAIARGAGEVAPLMLVGAVKLAPDLPVDSILPFIHPERSFMHLGFHVFDVGFQSQNSEAAKPMVFTTTLLLIAIVALLNVMAIWLRSKLRERFASDKF